MLALPLLLHESYAWRANVARVPLHATTAVSRVSRVLLLEEGAVAPAPVEEGAATPPQNSMVAQLGAAEDSEAVLRIVDANLDTFRAKEISTALHRVAARNKKKRARRDVLLRDERLERLFDAAAEQSTHFSSRCVADVLWSMATLQHFPSPMLMPVLTSVNSHLEKEDFRGQSLSVVVWSFAKLSTKPVRLLERIEEQALTRLPDMTMQNCANLLWGFATLGYKPHLLLPHIAEAMLQPGMLDKAKHVEVADIGFSLGVLAEPGPEYRELLRALATRAAPDTTLRDLSSRQICMLIDTFAALEATAELPAGLLDAWIAIVKIAHAEKPLMAKDARELERALGLLGRDATWIQQSDMLTTWLKQLEGRAARSTAAPQYTDEELRAVFDSIDTDQSGDIDMSELKSAVDTLGTQVDDTAIKEMMTFGGAQDELSVSFDDFKKIMTGKVTRTRQVEVV